MGDRGPQEVFSVPEFEPTDKSTLRQHPQRARYDRETVHAILDEALVCHVGFVQNGQPFVIPMNCARDGERLLLHGAPASRVVRVLATGAPVCITITLIDSLVVAAEASHHAMNYRCVMIFGRACEITDPVEKRAALVRFVEHFLPGHMEHTGPLRDADVAAVAVLAIPLHEVSAKIRAVPPSPDTARTPPRWAGQIPLRLIALPPAPAPGNTAPLPLTLVSFTRPGLLSL
jgi:nitroimidazol reductase NimA-like FMN-containing flavoprotein (pyridoxamine 5'-phosphate oxidase superfamily)